MYCILLPLIIAVVLYLTCQKWRNKDAHLVSVGYINLFMSLTPASRKTLLSQCLPFLAQNYKCCHKGIVGNVSYFVSFSGSININCNEVMPTEVMLSCTEGYIDVVYANWGQTQLITDVCPSSPPNNTLQYCYNSAMQLFSDCGGQRRCEVDVTVLAIDSCPTKPKHMQVMYLCHGRYLAHFA